LPSTVKAGPLQVIGPQFKEYEVGKSGIYAKFPHEPEEVTDVEAKEKNHFFRYGTFYVNTDFQIGYGELGSGKEAAKVKPEEILQEMAKELCGSMNGTDLKTTA
jgi:hypothetical protein